MSTVYALRASLSVALLMGITMTTPALAQQPTLDLRFAGALEFTDDINPSFFPNRVHNLVAEMDFPKLESPPPADPDKKTKKNRGRR